MANNRLNTGANEVTQSSSDSQPMQFERWIEDWQDTLRDLQRRVWSNKLLTNAMRREDN